MATSRRVRVLAALAGAQWEAGPRLPRIAAAGAALVGATGGGVALQTDDHVHHVVHASDAVMGRLEDLQRDLGEGPCVDAFATGRACLEPDLAGAAASARWTAFAPAAVDVGARAAFAFPLQLGAVSFGTLDLYRDRPGALSDEELGDALVLAQVATEVVLDLQAQAAPGAVHDQLLGANGLFTARIHQAAGMAAAQLGVGVRAALACLRARAFAEGRPLAEVAALVVNGELRLD